MQNRQDVKFFSEQLKYQAKKKCLFSQIFRNLNVHIKEGNSLSLYSISNFRETGLKHCIPNLASSSTTRMDASKVGKHVDSDELLFTGFSYFL